jgi:hypothetical protein
LEESSLLPAVISDPSRYVDFFAPATVAAVEVAKLTVALILIGCLWEQLARVGNTFDSLPLRFRLRSDFSENPGNNIAKA